MRILQRIHPGFERSRRPLTAIGRLSPQLREEQLQKSFTGRAITSECVGRLMHSAKSFLCRPSYNVTLATHPTQCSVICIVKTG